MSESGANSVAATSVVRSHSRIAKSIHWGFLAVFIYVISKQVDEVEELEDFALLQEEMTIAIVFLILLFMRFVYMRSTKPTVLPGDTSPRILFLAKAVHLGMYVSLALIAVTGLVIGGLYSTGTKQGPLMEAVLLSHEIVFWISVNLIGLHVLGAVYHKRLKDGVWNSMVPFWRE